MRSLRVLLAAAALALVPSATALAQPAPGATLGVDPSPVVSEQPFSFVGCGYDRVGYGTVAFYLSWAQQPEPYNLFEGYVDADGCLVPLGYHLSDAGTYRVTACLLNKTQNRCDFAAETTFEVVA